MAPNYSVCSRLKSLRHIGHTTDSSYEADLGLSIRYELPTRSHVFLRIFNLLGQEVATLVDKEEEAGRYEVKWDAGGIASGLYFYRLSVVPEAPRDLVPP